MKILKVVSAFIVLVIAIGAIAYFLFLKPPPPPISLEDRAELSLIPLPAVLEFGSKSIELTGDIRINTSFKNTRLDHAAARFLDHFDLVASDASEVQLNLIVTDTSPEDYPFLGMDETYELTISKDLIEIRSKSIWGAILGLESVKQLAKGSSLKTCSIVDNPRFPWRGLMIDVSRHWIPKSVILENLEAMAMVKLNVLHLHLSDYQGFRVESKVFPKLHELGSNGNYYTQQELKDIIEFAADRGIRVIPEFDLPGHATSWFTGYPELASQPGPYEVDTVGIGVFKPIMDPTKDLVYEFLAEFFGEMIALFPDRYFHIGGDEANYEHWMQNSQIQQFMEQNNFEDGHQLQAYFNKRLQMILDPMNKIMVGWDEILNEDLPRKGILTQVWRNQSSLWESARMGYPTLLSTGWYLDHKRTTREHYEVDPFVIKGGVTIEIDSTDWESWDLNITFNENEFQSKMYLFGKEDNPRGVLTMMGGPPVSFESVQILDGTYVFDVKVDIGTISWELTPAADAITGTASLGIIELDVQGDLSGSSNDPSSILPEFKKIEPLSEEEKSLVLGGETCMWTEMVDSVTINSRIWPRAAVIAERLWSDEKTANDTEDIYRRLILFDQSLEDTELNHYRRIEQLGSGLAPIGLEEDFVEFLALLEEDKMFNRMILYPNQTITKSTKLNRLVDAARSESLESYQFGKLVDQLLEGSKVEGELRIKLTQWKNVHSKFQTDQEWVNSNQATAAISSNLKSLSEFGLLALENKLTAEDVLAFRDLSAEASKPQEAVILAVAPHFEQWAQSISN